MPPSSGKTTPSTPRSGKGSQTTTPDKSGQVLPVTNPLDLWYLCQKVGSAERYPARDSKGRSLKQRQVTQWIRMDCMGPRGIGQKEHWHWPWFGEVGFDMSKNPPEAIMSRDEPDRPSTMPLSRYEAIRFRKVILQGVESGSQQTEFSIDEPMISINELEEIYTPEKARSLYKFVEAGNTSSSGKPKISGLLRIPDVIRLYDYTGRSGAHRFAEDNIAYLIEIKFEGDQLTQGQIEDYSRIVNYKQDKFRLLETKVCKKDRSKRRKWLEQARNAEPVFREITNRVQSPAPMKKALHAQIPQTAQLLYEIHVTAAIARNLIDPDWRQRQQQEMLDSVSMDATLSSVMVLSALRAGQVTIETGAAAGTSFIGGAEAMAAKAVTEEVTEGVELLADGAKTIARFLPKRIAVKVATVAAANEEIYSAAAKTPGTSSPGNSAIMAPDVLNALNSGKPLKLLLVD